MTRNDLNALVALLEQAGPVPRGLSQAIAGVDAYLTLAEQHRTDPCLVFERERAFDLWCTLQDAVAARGLPASPTAPAAVVPAGEGAAA
ncbi:hypothetical protein [Streptacidiphilus neutrinimicus]|uniref:hypothetical protein n=1 Tax=Streptacidiphilus neutrinimicus TaxID=105420 RepID=UPI0005AB4E34|nr:hypothetical protein [Streptacidiphilus neutrinimicus]